jgi:hypothetical protein
LKYDNVSAKRHCFKNLLRRCRPQSSITGKRRFYERDVGHRINVSQVGVLNEYYNNQESNFNSIDALLSTDHPVLILQFEVHVFAEAVCLTSASFHQYPQ